MSRLTLLVIALVAIGCGEEPLEGLDDATRRYDDAQLAFVGAQGFGTDTQAGRNGEIIVVDSLDGSGPGTLRAALEASGKRTVVFEVGGIVKLNDDITVTEPFVHVAGQTAPSPGINIFGAGIVVQTHDVVLRHLRIRPGDEPTGPNPERRDAIEILGDSKGETEVFNVVVDHCSLSWSTDELASTTFAGVRDITFSNNIFSEALDDSIHPSGAHSYGLQIGESSRRVAAIRNLFAHNRTLNPGLGPDASALLINNLIYNPGDLAMVVDAGGKRRPSIATSIGNVLVRGPSTKNGTVEFEVTEEGGAGTRVYMRDSGTLKSHYGDETRVEDPPPVGLSPLSILPSAELEEELLPRVGARWWDRGEVDERIIQEVMDRTGKIPDKPEDVGGVPFIDPAEPRELELPANPHGDLDEDQFTNLDRWLREFER